jgi:hypothetical protein
MSQRQPYISLDSVILDYLNETEQSQHKYFKLFHLAFRGFEQLGLDFFYQIKSVKLPINANLTVNIPNDFLNWTKVGVLNDRGEIIPLYYNDKLTTYADLQTTRIEKTQDDTLGLGLNNEWGANTWCNYWSGSSYINIYGVPSGAPFVGSFKIDMPNGIILLNESFAYDYLMLEYVSSPQEGEEYYLPVQFREALIAWLTWKDGNAKTIRSHMTLGDKRDKKSDFYNERRNAIARWKPIRKEEIYQASQEMTRLSIKS